MVQKKINEQPIVPQDVSDSYGAIYTSKGSAYNIGRTFLNTDTNISVKSEYTRSDYDYYRRYENSARTNYENIQLSLRAYDKVGIVRNVIDLMSDFVCKGIKLVHPVASQERFFNEWFEYVDGYGVSERFTNYLYRIANVPVNITYGKVPVKVERKWMSVNAGKEIEIKDERVEKRRIPLKYTFINPLSLEVIAPELAVFTGKPLYGLRITGSVLGEMERMRQAYMNLSDDEIGYIPGYIVDAIKGGKTLIPLDAENIKMYFYRKDDWKVWADSMIVPIMDDLIMLDKMKLADVSALDGAISTVRLWNLGHIGATPKESIIPTKELVNKVRNILQNNVGGGTLDLVWGPDIKFTETNTEVHRFLGKAKYEPVLAAIYEGLGVPFVSDSAGKGMTNNFIQMQTFIERLQYGRKVLTGFWNEEIKKVQKAMGYSKPALVDYDQVNLGDDSVYKTLLIQLLDRDAISVDSVLEDFGLFSKIEKVKIAKEHAARKASKAPPKASPFHNPQTEDDMKKIILQNGGVAPSEMDIGLSPRKDGEKSSLELQHEKQMELADKNNQAKITQQKYAAKKPNGRPANKKDSTKRKQKSVPLKTKGFMNAFLWGCKAQDQISDKVTPILLSSLYNKPNVRSLTSEEFDRLEASKLLIFSHIEPFTDINDDSIKAIVETYNFIQPDVEYCTKGLLLSFQEKNERAATIEEIRQIQASAMALCYCNENSEEDVEVVETLEK